MASTGHELFGEAQGAAVSAICAASGHKITISRQLAEGAEGAVYELLANPGRVAKVYHGPVDPVVRRKLEAMIRMRSAELEEIAAWPIELLNDEQARCVGFLMPRVRAPGDLDRLSHPAQQRVVFPEIDYGFLVRVARNLMRAGATLHRAGCVIGDVNQSNVRVLRDGSVRFADVDSFQVERDGELFPCTVGTGIFTPPELHGPAFGAAPRTPSHDGFGLAVLVFQLLMGGRHPFAGMAPEGAAGRSIEEAIRERMYAYSASGGDGVRPPLDALAVESLGELAGLFERAFGSPDRPGAGEWAAALERVEGSLRPCGRNPRHRVPASAGACPHCALARDPLPAPGGAGASAEPGTSEVAELIAQAGRLRPLPELQRRLRIPAISVDEADLDPPHGLSLGVTAGVLLAVSGLGLIAFTPAGLAPLAAGPMVIGASVIRRRADLRRRLPLRLQAEEALNELRASETRVAALEGEARAELGPLWAAVTEGGALLAGSDERLASTLAGAEESFRQFRLDEHLRSRLIARAGIPGVGVSWRAMLASFGIETAGDVTQEALQGVPALGPEVISQLLAWRLESEQSLPRARQPRAPSAWTVELRRRHAAWLAQTAEALRRSARGYRSALAPWDRRIAEAAAETDRARRACRAALGRSRGPLRAAAHPTAGGQRAASGVQATRADP